MKIIISGAGEVGAHLAKMLSDENHNITIIDKNINRLQEIGSKYDLMTTLGSTTSFEVLKNAGISQTDLFISVTEIEEVNITAAILAKQLGAKKTISRIDNAEFISKKNRLRFKNLGVDLMIYPQRLAALEIADLLKQTGSNDIIDFANGTLSLVVIKLGEQATIINKTLIEAAEINKNFNFRAIAISRNHKTIIPTGNDKFLKGDTIYIITKPKYIQALLKQSGKTIKKIKNILIIGGSRIGKKTAKELENHFNIKLIEQNKNKAIELADELTNTLVINGDGRDLQLLMEEDINKIDAVITVTDNSETNILLSLLAKQMGVKNTIAEIENIDFIELAENIGIDTIINKKMLAASNIYGSTLSAEVNTVKCLTAINAEVLEFITKPESKITKKELCKIKFPKDAIIGGLVRDGKSHVVTGKTQIQDGDLVIVFALPSAVHIAEKFFK